MAPKIPPEVAAELARTFKELGKRIAPLSEKGAESLARMSPEARVALDDLLGQGASLGEVGGTGRPRDYSGPVWPQPYRSNPDADFSKFTDFGDSPYGPWRQGGAPEETIIVGQTDAAEEAAHARDPLNADVDNRRGRVQTARYSNALKNSDQTADYVTFGRGEPQESLMKPHYKYSWDRWENIPAAVGTVATGGALLGASQAQADTGDGFRPEATADDGFEPEPISQLGEADGFVPESAPSMEAPQEAGFIPGSDFQLPQKPQPSILAAASDALDATGKKIGTRTTAGWQAVKGLFAPAQHFKNEYIDPLIMAQQHFNRAILFGGADPNEPAQGRQIDPTAGVLGSLREHYPVASLTVESAGKLAIGETEVTTPGSEHPTTLAALQTIDEKLGAHFGPLYAATLQSVATQASNLPFYLIPGLGENVMLQGATGGALSAVAEPGADIAEATGMGAAGGKVLDVAIKGAGKVAGAVASVIKSKVGAREAKRLQSFLPIAMVPGAEEGKLAEAIHAMPERIEVLPQPVANEPLTGPGTAGASPRAGQRRSQQPAVVAVDVVNGKVVQKGLVMSEDGMHSVVPPKGFKGKLVLTERAEAAIAENPTDPEFEDFWKPGVWLSAKPVPEGEIPILLAEDYQFRDDIKEGSVLVLEGGGGSGTARLYDVNDPKLQAKVLEQRILTEVTLDNGEKVLGFYSHGVQSKSILLPPETEELIPRAAQAGIDLTDVDPSRIRHLGPKEIEKVLEGRQEAIELRQVAEARQFADQSAREADIAAGGNGNGDRLPPNPPMDPPPPPPPNPHNVDNLEELRVRWTRGAYGTAFNRALLAPTVYGPRDVADKAMSAFSIQTFERLRDDTFKALTKATPALKSATPAKQRAAQQDLVRFITGELPSNQLLKNHPELAGTAHDLVQKYKNKIAENEATLRSLGMLRSEESLQKLMALPEDGELPGYATQLYYRFLMKPGEWRQLLIKDTAKVDRLVASIKKDVFGADKYRTWSEGAKNAEARRYFDLLTGDPERLKEAAMQGSREGSYLAEGQASLKARKDLRPWEKEALGLVDNAYVRVAESMTRQEQLILQGEMWKQVANDPTLSSFGDAADDAMRLGHTKSLPADPAKFGLAAGKRVSPDTYYALVTAPKAQRNATLLMNRFVNALKYGQTVGNPGSWVTNFFANSQNAMISNLVSPFASPLQVGHGMLKFAGDLKAHLSGPGLRDTLERQRFMRAMELGVIGSEYSTAEFRRSASDWANAMYKSAEQHPNKVLDILHFFPDVARKSKDKLAGWYSAIDSTWKYSTYINGLRKGGISSINGKMNVEKAIDFIGTRYREGMTDDMIREAVELEVARRIHFSFPMMDRVGEAVLAGGRAAGIINPYIKVKSELIRNYAQLPERVLSERGMAVNLMGHALTVGGMLYGIKHLAERNGINQKEVDDAFATGPKAFQRYKPGAVALPWRSSSGQLETIDLTQMFEPLTWLQGDQNAAKSTRFLQSMALTGINGSVPEEPITNFLAQSGIIPPAYAGRQTPEWQRGGAKMLAESVGKLGPGIIRNTYNTITKTEGMGFEPPRVRGPTVPQQSMATGVTNLLTGPGRITEVGSVEQQTREIQALAGEIKQAQKDLANIGLMREGQSSGMLTAPLTAAAKAENMKKARAVLDEKVARLKQLQSQLRSNP